MIELTRTPAQIEAERKAAEAMKRAEEQEAKRKQDEQKRQQEQASKHGSSGSSRGGVVVGGAMTTFDSNTGLALDDRGGVEERSFTHDEIHGLAGEVGRGELGHIHLDERGTPNGSAFKEIPGPDEVFADVYGNPAIVFDEVVTPSGAPITKYMNPSIPLWDAGMLARNPPPEGGRPGDRPKGPVGGGVVNTPVAR